MENILNGLIEKYRKDMEEALCGLVKIPSQIDLESASEKAPFGLNIRKALDSIKSLSESLGFEVREYDGYAASIRFGEEGKEVGILSHIDVVPPGSGWTKEPFEPVIEDGKMYGRGTIDDKGPMVAALYAMKAVKESGLPVKNHVNHIIGCDEETGHRCIKYYLTKERCPDMGFSPDGLFSVIHAEKGILRFRIRKGWEKAETGRLSVVRAKAGTVVNAVPNTAKVWLSGSEKELEAVLSGFGPYEQKGKGGHHWEDGMLVLEFKGVSAHAMQPWLGKNAILLMVGFLKDQPLAAKEMKEYFCALHALFADGWEGKNMGIACQDQLSGKLSMNLGILDIEGERSEINVDIRCPVHIDIATVWKTIELTCKKYGMEPEYWQMRPPLYVPKDAELVQKLLRVYNDMTGQEEGPITIGGGTYCRDVDNFVSFGPVFPGEPELAHEADEYIELDKLAETAKIYAQALYELMKE